MRHLILAATLLAAPASAETIRATRLVAAEHASGAVIVLDAADGVVLLRHDAGAPARLGHGAHHGQVALYGGAAGRVTLLESGLTTDGHGDHADVTVAAPRVLPVTFAGPRPSHVVAGGGRWAAFFDGDGTAQVVRADALDAPPTVLRVAHPHHGVAYPFASREGDRVAITSAPAEGTVPDTVVIVAPDGAEVGRSPTCPRVHGEARSGRVIAFGCLDGVLLLDTDTGTFRKVANPPGSGERAVRNLLGGEDWHLFAADFGPDGMAVVDPAEGAIRPVALPARRLHFALDPAAADVVHVLTEDGTLHALSTLDGTVRRSAAVTGRYRIAAGAALPRLSAAGGIVAVSDPERGRVLIVDAATLAIHRELALEGRPFDVRLVHVTGERH